MSFFSGTPYGGRRQSQSPGAHRHGDPETSRIAAEGIDKNALEAKVYSFVKKAGDRGMIWDEIVEASGIRRQSVSPRFKQLRLKGHIKAKEVDGITVKRDGESGYPQTVWVAVEPGEVIPIDPRKTPLGRLKAAWKKASEEDRREFLTEVIGT